MAACSYLLSYWNHTTNHPNTRGASVAYFDHYRVFRPKRGDPCFTQGPSKIGSQDVEYPGRRGLQAVCAGELQPFPISASSLPSPAMNHLQAFNLIWPHPSPPCCHEPALRTPHTTSLFLLGIPCWRLILPALLTYLLYLALDLASQWSLLFLWL